MNEVIRKLKGANMDIDLASPPGNIVWEQDRCPWNEAEHTDVHTPALAGGARECAVKNISICRFFCGVEYLDTLLCCYPNENPLRGDG